MIDFDLMVKNKNIVIGLYERVVVYGFIFGGSISYMCCVL